MTKPTLPDFEAQLRANSGAALLGARVRLLGELRDDDDDARFVVSVTYRLGQPTLYELSWLDRRDAVEAQAHEFEVVRGLRLAVVAE